MRLPVAILAGGLATRMRPLTEKIPKSLLEVAGEPFINHQLRLLQQHGVQDVVLCIGHLGHLLQEHVGNGASFGINVRYSCDGDKRLGTGGALKKALPLLGQQFMVLYGDSYLELDYQDVGRKFIQSGLPALMTVYRNQGHFDKSNILFRDNIILAYNKTTPSLDMDYIDYGLGCMENQALNDWKGDDFDLSDVYAALADSGKLAGYEVQQRFFEIGSPAGLKDTTAYISQRLAARAD